MKYYHFCNDFSLDLKLTSEVLGTAMDPTVISSVKFFTRKNGRLYSCTYGENTLIANGNRVTCVLNNHGLEPGVLQYVVELQIPDSIYPDAYKKIHQFFVSDIELVRGNGEQNVIDVEGLYGTTIDDLFNGVESDIDDLEDSVSVIQAQIVQIQNLNGVQNASINHIEDVLSTIDGGTSETIERLDSSVNELQSDVSTLNASVNSLQEETENNATGLTGLTNTVNDVSTRVNDVETILGRKADTSVLGNYYTKDETYNKDEVDLAIANAALDGSLPEGIVIDNNYVHTDNNYTTEDKNKVRDFDLSLYPTNSSLSANYATKAELQNVDDSHPTNASVSGNYIKKNEIDNYLTDYPTNASVSDNYAKKTDLNDYPTNTSVSDNYVHWLYANENYVSYENIDEIIFNTIDNNYDIQYKIDEVVTNSSTITDISTNVSDVSVKVIDVSLKTHDISTRLDRDYLTTLDIQRDYITNASVSANYTTKDEFNEVWTTGFLTQDSADELYASKNDVSVFVTDNDVSIYLTDNDVSNFVTNASVSANYASKNDISTFKPIVFISQNDYDTLVSNDEVDANTVYMIDGQPVTYLTANDVSNFVTDNDLGDYLTANDASIYVKENFGALSSDTKKTIVKYEDSSNLGELSFYIQNSVYDLAHNFNGNILKFDTIKITNNSKPYNLQRIAFNGFWGNGNQKANNYGSITFMRGISNSSVFNNNIEWGSGNFGNDSGFNWATIFVDDDGFGLLKYSGFNKVVTRYATADQINDVSNYVSANYASKNDISTFITDNDASIYLTDNDVSIYATKEEVSNDISTFITSNDVSIYATTSYVDTQIGNIQNILQTI